MLNYDIVTGESRFIDDATAMSEVELMGNPFPGLRPFTIEESHLFFGREGQIDEILEKLSSNRFVTVIGYSGSGKSSLMSCGLLPVLYGGFIANERASWNVVSSRPGNTPIFNLASSIAKSSPGFNELDDNEKALKANIFASLLKSNNNGISDLLQKLSGDDGATLIIIDQFEELFRFVDGNPTVNNNEATAFVQLILQAIEQTEQPIFVAITLRSDFIGRCADFTGLTDKINDSNYLVPQMTRDQKKLVIEGPVSVGGGSITPRLVKRLLNDVSEHQDQLPILQHAMMRTWDYWLQNKQKNEPVDIRHYQAVGGIAEALSQHADEAYDELDHRQKEIAEILFKTLTVRTTENQGIRRAARISIVAEIAGASEEEVIEVVEEFRKPGRSFLMPATSVVLKGDTNIEISHESLMRIWTRLKSWVDEEYESAQMYKRLSEAAAMYQIGKTGLWRPPDLQLALNWQKKQRPTRAWAQRYDEAFERAIVFLDTSRITYEAEQKNQEMVQRRLLRRTKIVAVVLGAAAVISIFFFIYAVTQQINAQKERDIAEERRIQATDNAERAEKASELAEKRNLQLEERRVELENLYASLADSTAVLAQQRDVLQRTLFNLQLAEQEAISKAQLAQEQTEIAQINEDRANENYLKASELLGLSVAQSMAIKSQFIDEVDLRTIVAQQAYKFHAENKGRINDPYIYTALHDAIDLQYGGEFNLFQISTNALRSVLYTKDYVYSGGSDGNIYKINRNDLSEFSVILSNKFPVRSIKISENNKFIAVASDSSFIQVINTSNDQISRIKGHKGFVYDLAFIPGTESFYSLGSDGELRLNEPSTGESSIIKKFSYPARSIAVSPSRKLIAIGTEDSRVFLLDADSRTDKLIISKGKNNPAHTVTFHPEEKLLAVGYEKGSVDLYDLEERVIKKELFGHTSKVNKVSFSKDGRYLATGSFDRRIYLWVLDELDELPTILDDHNGFVWDIDFSVNDEYLVAALGTGELKLWPTRPQTMAASMCELIFINMTMDQWRTFVGTEIDYERTCEDLPDAF